jgi:hypothetical protein
VRSQKVKPSCYAMKAPRGRGAVALTILDFGARWDEWSASRADRDLPPRKDPRYPLASDLVWTQRLEDKSFASAGDRTPVVSL